MPCSRDGGNASWNQYQEEGALIPKYVLNIGGGLVVVLGVSVGNTIGHTACMWHLTLVCTGNPG